jgi:hypothetical protein
MSHLHFHRREIYVRHDGGYGILPSFVNCERDKQDVRDRRDSKLKF